MKPFKVIEQKAKPFTSDLAHRTRLSMLEYKLRHL
jgi:hypothetical protein